MSEYSDSGTETAHAHIVRKAGVVSLAVLLSRITGLIREIVFAGLFGAGMTYDAFVAAYRIPNLLRDLLAEGALSSAFVTTYAQTMSSQGQKEAQELSNRLATLMIPVLVIICSLGFMFAPFLVKWIFAGYSEVEGKLELTVLLTRIMMPFLLFIALAAKAMGVLNAHGKFGIPALASSFFNVTSIGLGLLLGFVVGSKLGFEPIIGMAMGTLLGGVVQYICQIPSLRGTGLRFQPHLTISDPRVRQVLRLMGPAAIGAAAVQVNVMVNSIFASGLTDASGVVMDGPVSWLGYSFRFMQLPLGLFGVAVASATLPAISRDAIAGRMDEFRETLSRSLGLVMLLTMPSAVGLWILSKPLVGVVYQRGQFQAYDTEQTALALSFYCIGLVGYAAIKVLTPAFYALNNVRVPVMVSVSSMVLNYGLNKFFIDGFSWGHWALALSTSLVAMFNFLVLLGVMRSMVNGIEGRRLLASSMKICAASLVMGTCCWLSAGATEAAMGSGTFVGRLAALLVAVPLGVVVLYGICWVMRLPELDLARQAILKRIS